MCFYCNNTPCRPRQNNYDYYNSNSNRLPSNINNGCGGCVQNGWGRDFQSPAQNSSGSSGIAWDCNCKPICHNNCNRCRENCFKIKLEGIIKFC